MGNLITRRNRDLDSVVLDELNRALIPDIQRELFERLVNLESEMKSIRTKQIEIDERLVVVNNNVLHKNVTTGNDIYKINEALKSLRNGFNGRLIIDFT